MTLQMILTMILSNHSVRHVRLGYLSITDYDSFPLPFLLWVLPVFLCTHITISAIARNTVLNVSGNWGRRLMAHV